MKTKRFPNWHPKAGERALVPGGVAHATFPDYLRQSDVEAIETGHRGYLPLKISVIQVTKGYLSFERGVKTIRREPMNELLGSIEYLELYHSWFGDIRFHGRWANFASFQRWLKWHYPLETFVFEAGN